MNSRNEQLRQRILRIAEQERPALADVIARLPAIANRPVFLVAPESHVGMVHGPRVVAELHHVVAAIDDQSIHLDHIHGAPRWSSQEFLSKAGQYADAIAIDFSCSPRGRVFANDLCASAGIEQLSVAPSVDPPIPGFEQRPLFCFNRARALATFMAHRSSSAPAMSLPPLMKSQATAIPFMGCRAGVRASSSNKQPSIPRHWPSIFLQPRRIGPGPQALRASRH